MAAMGKTEARDSFPREIENLGQIFKNTPPKSLNYSVMAKLNELNDLLRLLQDQPRPNALGCSAAQPNSSLNTRFSRGQLFEIGQQLKKIQDAVKNTPLNSESKEALRKFIYRWDNLNPEKELILFIRFLPKHPEPLNPRELQALQDFLKAHAEKGGHRLEMALIFLKNRPDLFFAYPLFRDYFKSEEDFYPLNSFVYENFPESYSKFQKLYGCFDIADYHQQTFHDRICAGLSFSLVGVEKPIVKDLLAKARFSHMIVSGRPLRSITVNTEMFSAVGKQLLETVPYLSPSLQARAQELIEKSKRYLPDAPQHLQIALIGRLLTHENEVLWKEINTYLRQVAKRPQILYALNLFDAHRAKDVHVREAIHKINYPRLRQILITKNEGEFVLVLHIPKSAYAHSIYVRINPNSYCDQKVISFEKGGPAYQEFANKEQMINSLLGHLNAVYPDRLVDLYHVEKETYIP